jgi:hypothetical protein
MALLLPTEYPPSSPSGKPQPRQAVSDDRSWVKKAPLIPTLRTKTDDYELLAKVWHAANNKARELGWIV